MTRSQLKRKAVRIAGKVCFYCGGNNDHADHVVSTKSGGMDRIENLVPACASCNCRKGEKIISNEVQRQALAFAFINAPEVNRVYSMLVCAEKDPSFASSRQFDFIFSR